jgi:hypothetical protein
MTRKEHNAKIYAEARKKLEALKPPDACPDCPHPWDEHILPGIWANYYEDVDLPENKGLVLDPDGYVGCLASDCPCLHINEMAEWHEADAWLALDELLS